MSLSKQQKTKILNWIILKEMWVIEYKSETSQNDSQENFRPVQ